MTAESRRAIQIFYSYAQKDEALREELEKHLSNLKQLKLITDWHNRNISAGTEWEHEIDRYLNTAQIILLLISPDFMASDYCYSVELKRAMERHKAGETRVIPIILRPTDWKGAPFDGLQVLPTNGRPVTSVRNRGNLFLDIAKGIRKVVEEISPGKGEDEVTATLQQQYREVLYERWKMLDFRGIMHTDLNRPIRMPLADVFVFPDVLAGVPEYETIEREDIYPELDVTVMEPEKYQRRDQGNEREYSANRNQALRKRMHIDQQREDLHTVLAKHQRLVILGDPGSGKSTLLQYLLLQLAQGKDQFITTFPQLTDASSAVPLYVPLASYAEVWHSKASGTRSLSDFLPTYLHENYLDPYVGFLQQQLQQGNVFVLFDGLDEIPDLVLRIKVVRQIELFTQFFSENRFIVCSRIVGYKESPLTADYQVYTLADFNEEQIRTFTIKWCPAYEHWVRETEASHLLQEAATKDAEKLFQATQAKPAVKKLAVNPLLLTILALIQRQRTELPGHRIELFELCATTLLETWVMAKGRSMHFSKSELIKILRPLAFWMHEHAAVGAIPEEELTEQVVRQLLYRKISRDEVDATKLAQQFLLTMRGETGILVERGRHRYGFLHQTFEEYFAARELEIHKDRVNFIKSHLHVSHWREVILLTASAIGVLQHNEDGVTELIQTAILTAESSYDSWLHRDLLFAALCLGDDVGVSVTFEDEIIEQVVYLYLTSPFDSLRDMFEGVLNTWRGTPAGTKAVQIVLTLFRKKNMIPGAAPTSSEVSTAPTSMLTFEEKLAAYYQLLIKQHLATQINLMRLQITMVLHQLQVETSKDAQENLSKLVSNSSWQVRQAAATALGQFGAVEPHVLDALFPLLSDSSWQVRQATATAFGCLGSVNTHVYEALVSLLSDPNAGVRQAAASALGQLRVGLPDVYEALVSLLSDPNAGVRQAAATALKCLGSGQWNIHEDLIPLLSNSSWQVRQAAAIALGQLATVEPHVLETLLSLLPNSAWHTRQVVAIALGQFGAAEPRVLEALLILLSDAESNVRQVAVTALGHLGRKQPDIFNALFPLLCDSSWQVRQAATMALGQLGTGEPRVLEALLPLLSDLSWQVRKVTAIALGQLKLAEPRALRALLFTLSDSYSDVGLAAINALGQLDTNEQSVIDALLSALVHSSMHMRQAAVTALGLLGSGEPRVLEALLSILSDASWQVRQAAVTSLGHVSSNKPHVLQALLPLLSDLSWQVRQAVATALGRLSEGEPLMIEGLLSLLVDSSWQVQQATVIALGRLGIVEPRILGVLLPLLADPDHDVQQSAISALGQLALEQPYVMRYLSDILSSTIDISNFSQKSLEKYKRRLHKATTLRQLRLIELLGMGEQDVLEVLLPLLSHTNSDVQQSAINALGRLHEGEPRVVAALFSALFKFSRQVRRAAAIALGQIGTIDSDVLASLLAALSDPGSSRGIRRAIVNALSRLIKERPDVLEALLSILSHPSWEVRQAAASALGQPGITDSRVLEAILSLLFDSSSDVRQAAASALGRLGITNPYVLEALLSLLSNPSTSVRQAAISALGRLGSGQPQVLDALLSLLSDSYFEVRQATASALGQLGIAEPRVLEALLSLLSDSSWQVRQATASALGRLGPPQSRVLEALLSLLSDSSWQVRQVVGSELATLQIDRIRIAKNIEALLRKDALVAGDQIVADNATDALFSALQQTVGEV